MGTRLRESVPGLPKSMAPVDGRPFLTYVIRYLLSQGIQRFVFSLGYKSEVIQDFLRQQYYYLDYDVVIEDEPLGTGGAIQYALQECQSENVVVVNGDTLYRANIQDLYQFHENNHSDCTLALKPMRQFDRYGSVEINKNGKIAAFREKTWLDEGLINGGIYVIRKPAFLKHNFPRIFSFEKEFLEANLSGALYGVTIDSYFIDIGVPEDFQRAQEELKYLPIPFEEIDHTWTLFLDRDGVINVNKDESYVMNRDEFVFENNVPDAIASLSKLFGKVVVITNQRGVGKGLMTEEDLKDIHQYMKEEVIKAGGRIDDILYCTDIHNTYPDRKPNPGMAMKAKSQFPEIDFSKAIMVGDKMIDMEWGRNIGAYTVWIYAEYFRKDIVMNEVDLVCASLNELAQALESERVRK